MRKILVAYDGTEGSKHALTTAAQLAKAFEAEITVASVVPVHPGRTAIDPWDDQSVHAEHLREAHATLKEMGLEAHLLQPFGETAQAIERAAESGGFDTIVTGSRGLNAVERLLQGSVSEHVATHAKATVVIAR